MKKAINLSFFLLLGILTYAQDYLGDDSRFFQKKADRYQAWLDAKGLGAYLKVDKVELTKNGYELELFLSLRTYDPDSAAAMWPALKKSYAAQNPGEMLSEALYRTFYRFMEIPPAQGNMQIYLPLPGGRGYNPCLYIWLWQQDGKLQEDSRLNNCKAQSFEISIRPSAFARAAAGASTSINSREQARAVFDKILRYTRTRYERQVCAERNPRVIEEETSDYRLSFAVTDLCREVLTAEQESLWCRFVQRVWGPCNDMRRERLEFTFFYNTTPDGYTLTATLTGKFGSGVYVPRKSGYMDMEPDFEEDFLKPYVKRFQQDLKRHLEK